MNKKQKSCIRLGITLIVFPLLLLLVLLCGFYVLAHPNISPINTGVLSFLLQILAMFVIAIFLNFPWIIAALLILGVLFYAYRDKPKDKEKEGTE